MPPLPDRRLLLLAAIGTVATTKQKYTYNTQKTLRSELKVDFEWQWTTSNSVYLLRSFDMTSCEAITNCLILRQTC